MHCDRRRFLWTSSLAAVGMTLWRPGVFGQEAVTTFTELRGSVGIFSGRGGTIGWLVSPDGVLAVDSQFPDTAKACVDGLRERSGRAIDVLINTHHHGDHTGGNTVFKPVVQHIVAHANVPGLQKDAASRASQPTEQAYADVTFEDTWTTTIGKENVTATHYGPGHTGGDSVVFFANANVAHMGDLMFNRRHPFIDRPAGASVKNWSVLLEQVVNAHDADTVYIFGHAKEGLPVTGSKADLLVLRDYLSALLEVAGKGIKAGRSREEITGMETVPGFEDFAGGGRMSAGGNLAVAYDELTASDD